MSLSSTNCLVICNPLFTSLAERLARDYAKVWLHVPFSGSFPTMNAGRVGYGLDNVELVDEPFGPHIKKIDLVVVPDLYHSQLQIHLEEMGLPVWGCRNAEELEVYREICKAEMEKLGLPLQPWAKVQGVDGLISHLKAHPKQWVKIDQWRGVTETFFAPSYELAEHRINKIANDLGAFRDVIEFICEDDLPDRVEVGLDTYCIDGQYPDNTLFGIEAKDMGYVGQMLSWGSIPQPLRDWNETIAPLLARYGCRGCVSNEIRVGKGVPPIMVDATMRAPSPPNELWQELFTNLPEIMAEGAAGRLVEPIPAAKWGVEVILKSTWAERNWQPVDFPPDFEQQIKLFNSVKIGGRRYVVPLDEELSEIGAVIGWGDTLEAAMEHAKEAGEAITTPDIKFTMGSIETINEKMAELEEFGVSPFTIEKPATKE